LTMPNAQRRDAGNVVRRRSYIFTSHRHDNVLPAKVLAPVYGWFTEGFDTADLKEAKTLLTELA
jgi:hypothetical protein